MVTDSIKCVVFDVFPGYFETPSRLDIATGNSSVAHEKLMDNSPLRDHKIKKNLLDEIKKILDKIQENDARKSTNGIIQALLKIQPICPSYLERVEKEIKTEIDKRTDKLISMINTLLMETCCGHEIQFNLEEMKNRINRNREFVSDDCINDLRQRHRKNPPKKCNYYVDMGIVTDIGEKTKKLTATTESLMMDQSAQTENRQKFIKIGHKRNEKVATNTTTKHLKNAQTEVLKIICADDPNNITPQVDDLETKGNQLAVKSSSTLTAIETSPQDENESNLSKWCNKRMSKTGKSFTKPIFSRRMGCINR